MYYIEKIILTSVGIACFIAIWFIPRKQADKAYCIFMLSQFFSWIFGLTAVEFAWLDYPVRELSKANPTSFIFEYFALPILIIFFILHYPSDKPLRLRILYFVSIISAFTLIEYFAEKYTLILKYHSWKWYWTWISMSFVFYLVMIIYKWFFKIKKVFSL